jgi:hypothetical protein
LENRLQLLLIGEGAALILVIFGLYALSGAGSIRHLPLLRLGLTGISSLFLLRGLFFILTVLALLGDFKRRNPGSRSHFRPGVPVSRNHIWSRDCFELEGDASSQVKILPVSNTVLQGS